MIKAIIFDMDGVLVDSMTFHIVTWKKVFAEEGIHIDDHAIAINEGLSFKEMASSFSKRMGVNLSEEDVKRVNEKKIKYTRGIMKPNHYEGMPEFIAELKRRGIKTAVVTGSIRDIAMNILDEHFKNLFDIVVTSTDVHNGKPHPEPYLKAVELLKLKKEECIVVENAPLGIESAKAAGIKVYALETTLEGSYLKDANKVFRNHKDLIEHIKEQDLRV